MKKIFGLAFLLLFFIGCSSNDTQKKVTLMGVKTSEYSQKSTQQQHEKERQIEISKLEAQTKIELEKIKSHNQLQIAQLNATTQTHIAQTNAQTTIQTSQLDAKTKKENMQYTVYIAIAGIVVVLIAFLLLYLNSKKNRELQKKLHEEKLKHERLLKEKELQEQRVHKILELAAEGKLPKNIEENVILSLSQQKT